MKLLVAGDMVDSGRQCRQFRQCRQCRQLVDNVNVFFVRYVTKAEML